MNLEPEQIAVLQSAGIPPEQYEEWNVGLKDNLVHRQAKIDNSVSLGYGSIVNRGAVLFKNAYIGDDAVIGERVGVGPNAWILDRALVGPKLIIAGYNSVVEVGGLRGDWQSLVAGWSNKRKQQFIEARNADIEKARSEGNENWPYGKPRSNTILTVDDLTSPRFGTKPEQRTKSLADEIAESPSESTASKAYCKFLREHGLL